MTKADLINGYSGAKLTDFEATAATAYSYIHAGTFGRVASVQAGTDTAAAVQSAFDEIIASGVIASGGEASSESVGSWSRSLADAKGEPRLVLEILRRHLLLTGLLYAGIDGRCSV